LQLPDGGVRHGIETAGDPIEGEVSWLQSMPAYVFAPDILASYYYAAVVARFSRLLAPYNADMAKMYRESAVKAMRWGERDYARRKAAGILDKLDWNAKDDRNLAALQLYITTGEKQWHDIFLENTCLTDPNKSVFQWGDHVQRDAAFAYARLSDQKADPVIKKNALKGVLAEAEKALEYAAGNAYNLTTPDRGKPMMNGYYSSPDAIELVRAHILTGKPEYLVGAVQANQFLSGCNPNNITYTTGLGANPVQHPLHLDSRHSGQEAPVGLTVYGNIDFPHMGDWSGWVFQYFLGAACVPSAYEWPVPEAFFDIFLYPSTLEFTVDSWTPNVYVWGYLAARK
jgi:endoglucanase